MKPTKPNVSPDGVYNSGYSVKHFNRTYIQVIHFYNSLVQHKEWFYDFSAQFSSLSTVLTLSINAKNGAL